MSAPVTRRTLLGATAAVGACALPAIAEAGIPAADPDAALFELIARHAEADAALVAAEDEADRVLFAAVASYPGMPTALVWRPSDFPRTGYATGAADTADHDGQRRYRKRGVEWLRAVKPGPHWPESSEARRREIVEAWDCWRAACDAADRRAGVPEAEARRARLGRLFYSLDESVRAHRVRTLPGLRAKASWLAEQVEGGGLDETESLVDFVRQVAAFGGVGT